MDKTGVAITVLTMLVVLATGASVIQGFSDTDRQQEGVDGQVEYCHEHGGTVYNANSIAHGGLHCDLADGTTIHMWELEEAGYPSDPQELTAVPGATHESTSPVQQVPGAVGLLLVGGIVLLVVTAGAYMPRGV